MEQTKKDAGKDQRVVLNLNLIQANIMRDFIKAHNDGSSCSLQDTEQIARIYHRIDKTISKHQAVSQESQNDN